MTIWDFKLVIVWVRLSSCFSKIADFSLLNSYRSCSLMTYLMDSSLSWGRASFGGDADGIITGLGSMKRLTYLNCLNLLLEYSESFLMDLILRWSSVFYTATLLYLLYEIISFFYLLLLWSYLLWEGIFWIFYALLRFCIENEFSCCFALRYKLSSLSWCMLSYLCSFDIDYLLDCLVKFDIFVGDWTG